VQDNAPQASISMCPSARERAVEQQKGVCVCETSEKM
jgi:hypothetical protein